MQLQVQPQYAELFKAHPKARRIVENAWGLLKTRFQCCKRTLNMKNPASSAQVIKCCAILHNFLITMRDEWNEIAVAGEDAVADNDEVEEIHNNVGLNRIAVLNQFFLQANNL